MKMKNLNEYKDFNAQENVLEKARVNPASEPVGIYINGYSEHGGRSEHGTPHMCIKINGSSVCNYIIPTALDWAVRKEVSPLNGTALSRRQQKELVVWMDGHNERYRMSNIETLRNLWTTLNEENKNVKKFDLAGNYE